MKTSLSPRFSSDMGFFTKFKGDSSIDLMIVGLGNPGEQYRRTRHNCGFLAIDYIAEKYAAGKPFRKKFSALVCECRIGTAKVLLLKPQTFMNNSGEAVSLAKRFYKLPAENVLVISDDASLPLGRIRLRKSGSDGGQKGLRNIILHLSTDRVPRIKVGIACKDMTNYDLASFVLGAFDPEEMKVLNSILPYVSDAAAKLADGAEFDSVMSEFNGINISNQ